MWTQEFKNQNLRVAANSRTSTNCEIRTKRFLPSLLLALAENTKPERAGISRFFVPISTSN